MASPSPTACNYGISCYREDCKFKHPIHPAEYSPKVFVAQWANGDKNFEHFLQRKLDKDGAASFFRNKKHAKKAYDKDSSDDSLIADTMNVNISKKQDKKTAITKTSSSMKSSQYSAASFSSPEPTARKIKQTLPSSRSAGGTRYPIRIYCGGGKHCGHQVHYRIIDDNTLDGPKFCDGSDSKCNYVAANSGSRKNHQSNWDDVICAHNRCEFESKIHLIQAFKQFKCPYCSAELHGGIINNYGIVLH